MRGLGVDTLESRRLLANFTVDPNAGTSSTNFHTIADAIAAAGVTAETDDVINVAAGAFAEDVLINTPLSLRGAKFGIDPRPGRGTGETTLTGQMAVTVDGIGIDGFTVLNGSTAASPEQAAIYLNGANGSVANTILAGAGSGSGILTGSGVSGTVSFTQNLVSGFAVGARLVGDGTHTLANNAFANNATAGVQADFSASGNATLNLTGNTLSNASAQLSLVGGDASDVVSLSVNAVTLAGAATFVSNASTISPTGLSTTTFTIIRSTNEDTPLDIDLNLDGTALNPPDTTGLAGSVSVDGHVVTYTPTADFHGATSFGFSTVGGATGTVNMTVNPVNDPPTVGGDEAFDVNEGDSYTLTTADVSASDVDLPAQTLTVNVVSVTGGRLELSTAPGVPITEFTQAQLAGGEVVYVHAGGESSSATVVYTVSDTVATTAQRTITVHVVPINDPPVLSASAPLAATEGQLAVITSANLGATDPDNTAAQLVYTITSLPTRGTLYQGSSAIALNGTFTQADIDSGLVSYVHDGSETTSDSFEFTLGDGTVTLSAATFTINVTSENDLPTIGGDEAFDVNEGGSYTLTTADVDAADVDLPAQTLTFNVISVTGGHLELIGGSGGPITSFTRAQLVAGEVKYVHAGGEASSATITYTVSDGTAATAQRTITIHVVPINDPPIPSDSSVSTNEDVMLSGTLSGSDVDSSSLTYSIVDQPAHGTVNITDAATGAFTFTPAADWHGTTSFTFHIGDGSATSGTATVTVTVNPQNDAPIASAISPVTVDEGQSTTVALADYFADVDELDTPPDVLTYSLSGAPSFVSINPTTGVVTIAPGANGSGAYSFTAIATDSSNAATSTGVSLTVNNVVNNTPVISNLPNAVSIAENTTGTVFDVDATDADAGQTLVYSIVGGNEAGLFTIDSSTGVISLTSSLDAETAVQYTLVIRVTDNGPPAPESAQASLVVNVTDVNDLPTGVTISGPSTIAEGSPATFTANATDADVGAVLSYTWFVDDVEQIGQTGNTLSITLNSEGTHTVRVSVSDRGATPAINTASISVTDVAPTVVLSTSVSNVNEMTSFSLNIGPITDPGAGDVAAIGQVAIWWQDGTFTLINETENPDLLATIRAGGAVSMSHTYTDGQNAAKSFTVSVQDGTHSYTYNTSIIVNNVAPTGNFAAITPSVPANSAAFLNWFSQTDVSVQDRAAGLRYTYAIDVNNDGVLNAGDIFVAGDGTYANSSSASTIQIPGTFLGTAGTYSILGVLIDKDGSPFLTKRAFVEVTPSQLQVISLGGDHSGFTVVFNREIDLSVLNLYDGTDASNDTADVILTRSTGQTIRGSLSINAARNGFDFVVTGGILSQGTYTVRMNSGALAFKDLLGNFLDGDGNGIAGGQFISTFGVNAPPGPVLSVVDFARGPGQPVDVIPGNTASDLPVMMNSPIAVSSINFQMRYDSSLLTVSSVVAGVGLPAGWTVDYSVGTNALNISLIKTSPTALDIAAGLREIVRVVASVPNSPAIYGKSHVLSFATIVVNGNEFIEGTADRAVHKVVFIGDANRDGTLNVGDAGLIQTVVLGTVNGFDAYPIVDPVIISDSSRNNAVDSQDASNAALSGFTGARPADVPAFTPVTVPFTVGVDPTYRLPTQIIGAAGQQVNVPLSIIDDARGIQSGQLRIAYDTSLLDLTNLGITAGSLLGSGWSIVTNVNDAEGWFEVGFYSGTALAGGSALTGTLLNFLFTIASNASDGLTPLGISSPLNTPLSPTILYDRQGAILATTALSGSLLIDSGAPTVSQTNFSFNGASQSYTVVFSEDVSASIAASDFELTNLTTNTTVQLVVSGISSDGRTVTLTFASTGGLSPTVLKDGDYRLRVRAGQVTDVTGNLNAADADSTFFFMNADLNHDRTVNFDDLLVVAQHYGNTTGVSFSIGDVNYDGHIDFDDLLALAQRYGTSLVAVTPPTKSVVKKTRFSDSIIS